MSPLQGSYLTFAVLVLATYWFAVGCSDTTTAAPSLPPPSVSVIEVTSEDLPIYSEYAAQTFARDMVEVRGRVAAYDAFILRARKGPVTPLNSKRNQFRLTTMSRQLD